MYKFIKIPLNVLIKKGEFFLFWGFLLISCVGIIRSIQSSYFINLIFELSVLLCLLIYFFIKNNDLIINEISVYSETLEKLNDILFIIFYTTSLISLYFDIIPFDRPVIFFILFICMLGSVLIQILFNCGRYIIVLCKIIILVLFYILTQALLFTSFMSIDSYTHMYLTNMIVNTGFTDQIGSGYLLIFHFLHAEIELISGLSYSYSNLLVVLPSVIICTVLTIFLIGRKIIGSQIGLLASLILICSTYFLYFSTNLIPNSFSSVFLVLALFCLLQIHESKNVIVYTTLLFFFIIFTALNHLLTDLVLVVVLSSYLIFINQIKKINPNKDRDVVLIVFAIIVFFAVSIYILEIFSLSINFFTSGMDVYKFLPQSSLKGGSIPATIPIIEEFHTAISTFIFWIICIPGCLYLIKNPNKNIKASSFSYATLSLLTVFLLIYLSQRNFINSRFYYLISFTVCIFAAIFIILIFQSSRKTYTKVGVIIITLSLFIVCISSPPANITNNLYPSVAAPQTFPFESELSMISSLKTMDPKPLASDGTIAYIENRSGRADITSIDASIFYLDFINERDHTIILSDSIFKNTPGKEIFYPEKEVIINSLAANKFSKMFDCGRAGSYTYLG